MLLAVCKEGARNERTESVCEGTHFRRDIRNMGTAAIVK